MSERYSEMEIEPLLELGGIKILHRLKETLSNSISMRAAIACYAIHLSDQSSMFEPKKVEEILGHYLPAILAKDKGGFLCCDFMSPTNFDYLKELVEENNKARIFIHWRKMKGNQSTPLLHSKLLLFELENGKVEIWAGSHNWTKNALTGPQLNFSMIIHAEKGHPYHLEIENELESYRKLCEPFDPKYIDWYKKLQKATPGRQVNLIELEVSDPNAQKSIEIDSQILLFDEKVKGGNLKSIAKRGTEVFLSISNPNSQKVTFYKAMVREEGDVDGRSDRFKKCRFVGAGSGQNHAGQNHVLLEAESEPEIQPNMKDAGKYIYVFLRIIQSFSSLEFSSSIDIWRIEEKSLLAKRFIEQYRGEAEFFVPINLKEEIDKVKKIERSPDKLIVLKRTMN